MMNNIAVINGCFTEIQAPASSHSSVHSIVYSSQASHTTQDDGNQLNVNVSGTLNQTFDGTETDINRDGKCL